MHSMPNASALNSLRVLGCPKGSTALLGGFTTLHRALWTSAAWLSEAIGAPFEPLLKAPTRPTKAEAQISETARLSASRSQGIGSPASLYLYCLAEGLKV